MEQKFDIAWAKWNPPPLTVEDLYGGFPTLPEGWEVIDFRPAKRGEKYIDLLSKVVATCEADQVIPRLIVRAVNTVESIYGAPLEKITPPRWYAFTGEFRSPKIGELYMHPFTREVYCISASDQIGPRLILRRAWKCEVELEDIYSDYNIPKGYRAVDFRIPREGDLFVVLTLQGGMGAVWDFAQSEPTGPRLIVEKI